MFNLYMIGLSLAIPSPSSSDHFARRNTRPPRTQNQKKKKKQQQEGLRRMSSSSSEEPKTSTKYAGVRRRKWGKWVSEIRVPGTQERLWLGSYSTPEGAAVAHDIASYCLRGPSCLDKLNFPSLLPPSARPGMSPGSVQRAASDAGMAIDAQYIARRSNEEADGTSAGHHHRADGDGTHVSRECAHGNEASSGSWGGGGGGEEGSLSISVDDYL